jgi:hypothetical protein
MGASSAVVNPVVSNQSLSISYPYLNEQSLTIDIADWIRGCDMFDFTGKASFDFPNFPETNKVFHVVYFKLSAQYINLKGLLNGLAMLGQPKGVVFEYQKELKTYSFKYYAHENSEALTYIQKIVKTIYADIRFKQVLSALIQQEKDFVDSQKLLKKELFS